MKNLIPLVDYYQSPSADSWSVETINEKQGKDLSPVDGVNIIGCVKGPFFCPDSNSLNKRHYTYEFWENILNRTDIKQRLEDRLMFGRIGHEDREVTEDDLNNGLVSHIITDLSLDPKNRQQGIGEALILSTPAGRNLFTYLKAKCRLKTSSRGAGVYKEGVMVDAIPVVDEENYILETFDFVMRPRRP